MAKERKTMSVDLWRHKINDRIRLEEDMQARRALCSLLSDMLMDADRYRGFYYIDGWKGVDEWRHQYY